MTAPENIVVVGASLAGLRAAEALRLGGYAGRLTLVGDEPRAPYDRPPLSKQVLSGWVGAHQTTLPRQCSTAADWRLGVSARSLDRAACEVVLSTGERLAFDRLVIATGARARPWPDAIQSRLGGVHTLRTAGDAQALLADLDAAPSRVLVIGAGFTGCEVASACRDRGLAVTVVERNSTPLQLAVGPLVGAHAARLQRSAGVDLRCEVSVAELVAGGDGRVRAAMLTDGSVVEAQVVVVCLGAIRNTEWLAGANLDAGPLGVLCNSHCQVLDHSGSPVPGIFTCGDVARFPHPLAQGRPISLEHWGNAVEQASIVASKILQAGSATTGWSLPRFWSMQFGAGLKSAGLPSEATEVAVVQGDPSTGRFVAAYGRGGQLVGVVAIDHAQWMDFYERLVAEGAPFPLPWAVVDRPPVEDSSDANAPIIAAARLQDAAS